MIYKLVIQYSFSSANVEENYNEKGPSEHGYISSPSDMYLNWKEGESVMKIQMNVSTLTVVM